MKNRPILVVCAMMVEAKVLIDKLDNVIESKKYGYTFYEGYLDNKYIVMLVCGVGVINASSGLMIGIMEYNPIYVINYGIAGAMSKDIHTKDIIIAKTVSNINSYRTLCLNEGEGTNPDTWELLTFLSGQSDKYIEYESDTELLELTNKINYNNGNVIYGKIGSGDVWNREVDRILYLNKEYGIICEDMESIAIYQLANNFNIKVISIKIISDNSLIGEEYDREVGVYLVDYIIEFLKKIKTDN